MTRTEPRVIEAENWRLTLGKYVEVADHHMPEWVEIETFGFDSPDFRARIELRDNVPRLVELSWRSKPGSREIMRKDLDQSISVWIDTLYAQLVIVVDRDEQMVKVNLDSTTDLHRAIRGFLEDRRSGKRRITGDFLQQVAAVYRQNIDYAPTATVARTFGVKHRQATDYVKQARDRGFLPPTKQGRAKA